MSEQLAQLEKKGGGDMNIIAQFLIRELSGNTLSFGWFGVNNGTTNWMNGGAITLANYTSDDFTIIGRNITFHKKVTVYSAHIGVTVNAPTVYNPNETLTLPVGAGVSQIYTFCK